MNICPRCGREITSDRSRELGIGRGCADHAKENPALADFKPAQIEKAWQLISDGGIVLVKHSKNPIFSVVASNGVDRYLVAPQACTCPAGLHDRKCYHRLSAMLIAG